MGNGITPKVREILINNYVGSENFNNCQRDTKFILMKEAMAHFRQDLAATTESRTYREWLAKYRLRPEIRARNRKYMREYQQRPEVKEKTRKRNQLPEVKAKMKLWKRKYSLKMQLKNSKEKTERLERELAELGIG